uniref:Ig-like domain-containing protein n=1 Tax=Sander lucioperca TaxID=283035 RepID=A0A8D0AII8_SANLU
VEINNFKPLILNIYCKIKQFWTKTVGVGQNVTLTCTRQRNWHSTNLFWIRLVSGTFPEFLGGTIAYDFSVFETRRITAKQEPGTFVLHITNTQISDTAVYYCIKVRQSYMTFSKGIFLRIKGPESDITAVTLDFPSVPVRPGDSVTLQCSVLSDSENKRCTEEHSVFWFRAGSDKSHPSLIYAQGNNSDGCEKSPEALSSQKCIYSFSKNVSSSDAGTYYCAVATCGEILFGNGIKLDSEGNGNVFLCYGLITTILSNNVNNLLLFLNFDYVFLFIMFQLLEFNDAAILYIRDDSVVYYTPNFTRRKAGNAGRKNATAKDETIYSDVRAFVTINNQHT